MLGIASVSKTLVTPFKLTMSVHDMADWTEPLAPLLKTLETDWGIGPSVIDYKPYVTNILDISNPQVVSEFLNLTELVSY